MRLTELEPEFIRWEDRVETRPHSPPGFDTRTEEGLRQWNVAGCPTVPVTGPVTYLLQVQALPDAQGIEFDCPKCRNHRIHVAFAGRGVADHHGSRASDGRPTRWQVVGTGFDDITLTPSVDCTPSNPNCWHGFITNGSAV